MTGRVRATDMKELLRRAKGAGGGAEGAAREPVRTRREYAPRRDRLPRRPASVPHARTCPL